MCTVSFKQILLSLLFVFCFLMLIRMILYYGALKFTSQKKSIYFYVGGRSGGHIIPLIALAKEKKYNNSSIDNVFFISNSALDLKIITKYKDVVDSFHPLKHIALSKTYFIFFFGLFLFDLLIMNIGKFLLYYYYYLPEKIYTTGGAIGFITCLPIYIINLFHHLFFNRPLTKIIVYHLDAIPGKAGQKIARCADKNYICFDSAKNYLKHIPPQNIIKKPIPILFTHEDLLYDAKNIKEKLNIPLNKKVLLILGGSQGSEEINKLIVDVVTWDLSEIDKKKLFIIHQTGKNNDQRIKALYSENKIESLVFDFVDSLKPYYQVADFIIMRGGAMSIGEVSFFSKLAIIIPLRTVANDHQYYNAQSAVLENKNFLIFHSNNDLIRGIKKNT